MSIENLSIDKSLLGNKENLIYSKDSGFQWSNNKSYWHYSYNDSLNTIFKLSCNDFEIHEIIPQKYINVVKNINLKIDQLIPWSLLMNNNDRKTFMKSITKKVIDISNNISERNIDYFENIFKPRIDFLQKMQKYHINNSKLDEYLNKETNLSVVSILKSFLENKGIKYNNFGTKTGRLTVSQGPNILTLKKDYRDIFQSRFGNDGKLISIDFSSLEVRLLLLEAGKNISGDIYQKISDLTKNVIPRDVIKKILISMLYGASQESLLKLCSNFVDDSYGLKFLLNLKSLFKINDLLEKLRFEARTYGKITNKFGRNIKTDAEDDGILLNYYFQSTGADFSLVTFNDFLNSIDIEVEPVFVIHDSLVLDIKNTDIQKISALSSIQSKYYDYYFPIKVEEF